MCHIVTNPAKMSKEIYETRLPWLVYCLGWSHRKSSAEVQHPHRLVVGSFLEEYNNKLALLATNVKTDELEIKAVFEHPYPATGVSWIPDEGGTHSDLVATTGDYLRLWSVSEGNSDVKLKHLFNNVSYIAFHSFISHHPDLSTSHSHRKTPINATAREKHFLVTT